MPGTAEVAEDGTPVRESKALDNGFPARPSTLQPRSQVSASNSQVLLGSAEREAVGLEERPHGTSWHDTLDSSRSSPLESRYAPGFEEDPQKVLKRCCDFRTVVMSGLLSV